MSGSVRRRASSTCGATLASKALTLLLAFTFALSLVPTAAWGQLGGQDASSASEGAAASSGADVGDDGSSAAEGGSAFVSDPAASAPAVAYDGDSDPAALDADAAPAAADADPAPLLDSAPSDAAAPPAANSAIPAALTSNARVYIQDEKDKDSTYSQVQGVLSAGDVLWANLYDGSYSWSMDSVPSQDGWAYQWLSASEASGDVADYEPIEGANEQSLTVSDAMAGRYLIVRVTVDGIDYYAPSVSYGTGINRNYLPGPVLAAGQAQLYSVTLSSASPSVGDTLTATANKSYGTPVDSDVNVTFTWQQGDSRFGTFQDIEGAGNGPTFTLTEAQQGKYIRVVANAGVNDEDATTSDPVIAEGAVRLAGVELEEPASLEMPIVLTAKAYAGSSYKPTYVTENVTYTWKYAMVDPTGYSSSDSSWQIVPNAQGPTLAVDGAQYAGAYFSVEAYAGANTVELSDYSAVGPVKLAGQVDIHSVSIVNADGTSVFRAGDTATARVREQGAPSGEYVDTDKLNFQWLASADGSEFAPIEGATGNTLEIDESLVGSYLRCQVSSKVGSSSYAGRVTLPVGAADAVHVTSVTLDKSGKVSVGDTLTATARASSEEVTASEQVTWSWYCGSSATTTDQPIEGAHGNTLQLTDDLLGKYVEARADGGFGQQDSSAAGPVVQPGAVELYRVEASGDARVGSTVSATAYKNSYNTRVESGDVVSYQWQYATTSTTSDSAFADIPGATSADFTIPATIDGRDAVGLYLRVKAVSDGKVVSTYQKSYSSYHPPTYVDPLGPIALAGQYTLTAVEIESSGQGMQAGSTITPTAMVEGAYYGDDPAPADAKLTFTWYASDAATGPFAPIEEGYDPANGALALSSDLAGRFVKVQAYALDNTVESAIYQVLPEGTYDLLRVITAPAINGSSTLLTGAEVQATAYAKRFDSATIGDDVTDSVSFQWLAGASPEGEFTPLEGANGARLTIPAEAAGRYLKVVATSGASSVEQVSAAPVEDAGSLAGIVATLENESWRPQPAYGTDVNLNDVLTARLADGGVSDVQVRVKTVAFQTDSAAVEVGVSAADDATNGQITYANYLPENASGWVASLTAPRSASVTFVLSRDGEDAVEFTPSMRTVIPWDEAACADTLRQAAQSLAVGYASGDSAASVTQDVELPHSIVTVGWRTNVSWASDSDAIVVEGYSWDDESTGAVTRASVDQAVTLTATVAFGGSDVPETTVEVPFSVTVKADPDAVEQAKAELQGKIDAAFSAGNLTYVEDQSAVDAGNVTGDVQLPRPSALGIDGADYTVTYTASNDAMQVNGYRGNAYQPLPGAAGARVDLTLAVTSRENAEITATKTVSLTVTPLEASAIQAELELMGQAKAGYAAALANGQDASAVTGNLSTFQKAYFDDQGNLAWARDYASANAAGDGIVTEDLEPDDDMGVVPGHWFKSSDADVVAHDTLLVTQPDYDTQVTVTSSLASEKYARYAQRYADDGTWGAAFSQLADQQVSATFVVKGTRGAVDPQVTASLTIVGVDADGNDQTWLASADYTLEAGATAADLSEQAFAQAGITADYDPDGSWGWALNTITSPFDPSRTLGYDADTGRYWQLFVNGQASDLGAGSVTLQAGDSVIWYYSAYGAQAPSERLSVMSSVIGVDAAGADQAWIGEASYEVAPGTTAADLVEQMLGAAGLEHQAFGVGTADYYLSTIISPDGRVLGWDEATGKYWQLFVNGKASELGAGQVELKAGDSIVWYYSASGDSLPGQVRASVEVLGADANGAVQRWLNGTFATLLEGATAADLTEAVFVQAGITADIYTPETHGYWMLNTVTSPYDADATLGYNSDTGAYWQLFINGEYALVGADGYTLQPGDTVSWVYGADGTMPGAGDIVVDPTAPRPDWTAEWPGFADAGSGSAVTQAPTPTQGSEARWQQEMKDPSDWATYVSDPIIVNRRIYIATGSELRVLDAQTGATEASAALAASIDSVARMVYADGVVVVPLSGGRLQALTADALTTVWLTAELDAIGSTGTQQSLTSLLVRDDCVYYGTTAAAFSGSSLSGYFLCVSLEDGSVRWSTSNGSTGYYWSGAAAVGDWIVVADDAGTLSVRNAQTGEQASFLPLGAQVRASVVAGSEDGVVFAVSNDGVLHKVRIDAATGSAAEVGRVAFGTSSTSTPTIADGKVYVGGVSRDGAGSTRGGGVLAVIDEATLTIDHEITGLDGGGELPGDVKSAPLVSLQGGQVYVYFTCNSTPGGIYSYRVGDASAMTVFTPDADHQNYSMTSVVCGADGTLYYVNDSGALFAVAGAPSAVVTFQPNNGAAASTVYVALGSAVIRPTDPVRDGYRFVGWYSDQACTVSWDFSAAVTDALTLYAKWEAAVENPQEPGAQGPGAQEPGGAGNPAPSGGTGATPRTPTGATLVSGGAGAEETASTADGSASAPVGAQVLAEEESINDDGGQPAAAAGFPWWAVVGIVIGACGVLGAGCAWFLLARRRKEEGEGGR